MTVQEVVLDLLSYIGVIGFADLDNANALNRSGLDDIDTQKALGAVNYALQQIAKFGPKSLKETERAAYFYDPTIVSVAVDADVSQSITLIDPPAWIPGCSILIEGDNDLNRIVDVNGTDVSLLRGYRGATNPAVSATIYSDCALLPDDIVSVVEPVTATPNRKLTRARDLQEFMRFSTWGIGYEIIGYTTLSWAVLDIGASKVAGQPSLYWVETRQQDRLLYLRLTPMPIARGNVTYQAKLAPFRVDVSMLDTTGGADPGIEFTTIPDYDQESVLLPIARWKFFSHPSLRNAEIRATVNREYEEVMLNLRHGAAYEAASGGVERVTYV